MITHIVQSGDTLYLLSKQYNVTVQAIINANNLTNPNALIVGQTLTIPVNPTLRRGDRGSAVTDLQNKLLSFGYNPGPVDGIFGRQTDTAVRSFQTDKGLTADGIVGPNTWAALSAVTPSPQPGIQKYRVQPGDTLAKIAGKFGVPVQSIVDLNHLSDPNMIFTGEELLIPQASVTPPPAPTPPPPSPQPETGPGWLTLTPAVLGEKLFAPSPLGELIVLNVQTGAELGRTSIQGLDSSDRYIGGSPSGYSGMIALPGVYNIATWIS